MSGSEKFFSFYRFPYLFNCICPIYSTQVQAKNKQIYTKIITTWEDHECVA